MGRFLLFYLMENSDVPLYRAVVDSHGEERRWEGIEGFLLFCGWEEREVTSHCTVRWWVVAGRTSDGRGWDDFFCSSEIGGKERG